MKSHYREKTVFLIVGGLSASCYIVLAEILYLFGNVADGVIRFSICDMPSPWLFRAPLLYVSLHAFTPSCQDSLPSSSVNRIANCGGHHIHFGGDSWASSPIGLSPSRNRRRLGQLSYAKALGVLK